MTDTDALINQLSRRAQAVQPLASPLRRTLLWLLASALVIGLIAAGLGWKTDSSGQFTPGPRLAEWLASLATSVLAAYAVFQISVPGRSPSWAWLPLPAALAWLAFLGWGCLAEYAQVGPAALAFQSRSLECLIAVVVVSVPLGVAMLLSVRHAGVIRPAPTAMLAALSTAAMTSAGDGLVHTGESSLMVLVWHVGAVALLSLLALASGRRLFAWIGPVHD